jgi:heme exporter protein C
MTRAGPTALGPWWPWWAWRNVPVIYFSVRWWNTLHQGASVSVTKSPSMAAVMLWAMLIMTLAFWGYAVGMAFYRVRQTILEREQDAGVGG